MTRKSPAIWASAALIAVGIATLSGCHGREKASGHGTVSGQILPGSVSDAMLPYDSVKSKAPLAPAEASGGSDYSPGDNRTDSAVSEAAAPDSAVPAIAASPSSAVPAAAD